MNILFRDSKGNLRSQEIEDMRLNMRVEEVDGGEYQIKLERNCVLEGTFKSKEDAENQMIKLTNIKNDLDND